MSTTALLGFNAVVLILTTQHNLSRKSVETIVIIQVGGQSPDRRTKGYDLDSSANARPTFPSAPITGVLPRGGFSGLD